jgi:predicted CXXCH cytochrome family protein
MNRRFATAVFVAVVAISWSCSSTPPSPEVFSPARDSLGAALRDFYGIRPEPRQPIEFPHDVHATKAMLACTDFCHETVSRGPQAGLPSINTCMVCHQSIATDRPLVMDIAALADEGLDVDWKRVYGYPNESHVRFNHAPHIRANVECTACHGDVASQTVARRNVDQSMGFCVGCHTERQAPNECVTCHF